MKRLIIGFLVFCSVVAQGRLEFTSDIDQAVEVAVGPTSADVVPVCSGGILKNGYVVTAAHCIVGSPLWVKIDGDWDVFTPIFVGVSGTGADFAVLKGNTKGIKPFPISDVPALKEQGAVVTSRSQKQKIVPIALYKIDTVMDPPELILLGEILKGDSGAPVLGKDGKVKGIVFALSHLGEYGFAVPIAPVKAVLDKLP